MFLLFDVSTNGRPKNWKAPFTDTFSWPRMIHIAWLLYDKKGNLTEEGDYLIKPQGFEITQDALSMHKLDPEIIQLEGKEVGEVLDHFKKTIDKAYYIFSFNLQYNESVLLAEFYRTNKEHKLALAERYCLMRESTYFCKIIGKDGRYKWPTLNQLHEKLFNIGFDGAGNAKADVTAVSRCFNKLLDLGQLDDLF